jgi:hypothetical protein
VWGWPNPRAPGRSVDLTRILRARRPGARFQSDARPGSPISKIRKGDLHDPKALCAVARRGGERHTDRGLRWLEQPGKDDDYQEEYACGDYDHACDDYDYAACHVGGPELGRAEDRGGRDTTLNSAAKNYLVQVCNDLETGNLAAFKSDAEKYCASAVASVPAADKAIAQEECKAIGSL